MRVARRLYRPVVQEMGQAYDFVVPITKKGLTINQIMQPTMYVKVSHDKDFYYALYCLFHRWDWSKLPWPDFPDQRTRKRRSPVP